MLSVATRIGMLPELSFNLIPSGPCSMAPRRRTGDPRGRLFRPSPATVSKGQTLWRNAGLYYGDLAETLEPQLPQNRLSREIQACRHNPGNPYFRADQFSELSSAIQPNAGFNFSVSHRKLKLELTFVDPGALDTGGKRYQPAFERVFRNQVFLFLRPQEGGWRTGSDSGIMDLPLRIAANRRAGNPHRLTLFEVREVTDNLNSGPGRAILNKGHSRCRIDIRDNTGDTGGHWCFTGHRSISINRSIRRCENPQLVEERHRCRGYKAKKKPLPSSRERQSRLVAQVPHVDLIDNVGGCFSLYSPRRAATGVSSFSFSAR